MTRHVQKQLLVLNFHRLWAKSGLIDAEWLARQVAEYKASGSAQWWLYHLDAFQHALDTRPSLTDPELTDYVTLALKEAPSSDPALALLIGWRGLRPHQLPLVREQLEANIPRPFTGLSVSVQAALDRRAFLFSLATAPLPEDAFERYLASGDADVQEMLLKRKTLTSAQLRSLKDRGASRAVREAAAERLSFGQW